MRSTQQEKENISLTTVLTRSSSCPPSRRLQQASSSSLFLKSVLVVVVICWLSFLPVVSSQSNYLLTKEVLNYIDVVAQLMEHTTKQDLNSQLSDIATGIGFSTLSFLWEAPSDADVSNFAQVILGRKDTTCYAVFHGLSMIDNEENDIDSSQGGFVSNPKPIPNLRRPNCNIGTDVCACRAHWTWVEQNFPTYWQDVHSQLDTCMESCALRNNNEQCDLVFGGHGSGGAVAALLSFHFAASNPYVITAGSPDVMYNSNCQGINEDRYFRFINTDTPGKDIGNAGGSAFLERLYLYGVCFDEIPFTNGSSELRGLGTTIAMGLEKGGMAVATGGTGQLNTLEDEATRTSLCRSAHDMLSYKQKMQSAVWRNPLGVTPVGFSNFQYCEIDQDCRAVSTCEASDDYPICTDNSVAPPTPFPTRNPTTPRPSPRPSPTPTTPGPTGRPTPRPTTAPPTPRPSPGPTPRPSASPTTAGPTTRPTPIPTTSSPTPRPSPGPSLKPSPGPTREPTTAEPTKSATDSPTWPPTVSPTSQPSKTPTLAPITPQPTQAEVITDRPTTVIPTRSPTAFPSASPSWGPTVPIPEEATGAPTSSTPSSSPSSPLETINGNNAVPTTKTMAPSAGKADFVNTRQPTETPAPSTVESQLISYVEEPSPTSLPTTVLITKPPAEYDSNDSKDTAPTQEPVVTPPPTWSTSALPLFDAFFRTTLVLRDVKEELTGFTMFWWEDETSDHLRQWIDQHTKDNNWDPPIVQLRVQTNIVSQSVLFVSAPATDVQRDKAEASAATISSILEVQEEENESQKEEMKKDKKSNRRSSKRSKKSGRVRHRHQRQRGRRLQATTTTAAADVAESLQIVFEIAIAYRTLNVGELDLHGLILEAFQNEEGRKQYGKRLQKSNDPVFVNLSDFILQIEESPTNVETALEESNGGNGGGGEDKTIIWALIGAACAAVVLSLGMFLWYLKGVSNKGRQKLDDDYNSKRSNGFVDKAIFEPASGSNERLSPDGTKSPRLSQEIVVDQSHDDGISTLGDPTFYPGAPPMLQDEQTASVNYAQNYLKMHDRYDDNNRTFRSDQYSSARSMMKDTVVSGGGGSFALTKVGSGLSHLNESAISAAIFSDDDSFEQAYSGQTECFKVSAPPGKLGIIIDLSGNGEPMVRAIRGDSTLADQVQIGDLLLSVDGETVAEMSPEQVSKLIAVKSNQPVREIMFVRKPADYR